MLINKLIIVLGFSFLASISMAKNVQKKEYFNQVSGGGFVFNGGEKKTTEVLYFFSHNCGACATFTPMITDWKEAINSKEIDFRFIPTSIESNSEWAAIAHFAIKNFDSTIETEDISKHLWKHKAVIDTHESAAALISDLTNLTYEEALGESLLEKYDNYVNKSSALFNEFQAEGTPNIGITMADGSRYLVGPQHGNSFNEMLSVLDALISYK